MKSLFASVVSIVAFIVGNASAEWEVTWDAGAKYYRGTPAGNYIWSSEYDVRPGPGQPVGTIDAAGSMITSTDGPGSWIQFDFNVNKTTKSRGMIVFRNPLDPRVSPILAEFEKNLARGRSLVYIRNLGSTQPTVITNGWMGWTNQTSYDINPGDKVMFFFK